MKGQQIQISIAIAVGSCMCMVTSITVGLVLFLFLNVLGSMAPISLAHGFPSPPIPLTPSLALWGAPPFSPALFSFSLHCQCASPVLPVPHAQHARSPLFSFHPGWEQCMPCARWHCGGASGSAGASRGCSLACPPVLPEPQHARSFTMGRWRADNLLDVMCAFTQAFATVRPDSRVCVLRAGE